MVSFQNPHVEDLIPDIIVFGEGIFQEVIKVKMRPQG